MVIDKTVYSHAVLRNSTEKNSVYFNGNIFLNCNKIIQPGY